MFGIQFAFAARVQVTQGLTNSEIEPSFIEQKLGFIH
jgi:hypothetical protein